jgi:hypothetical protein
MPYSLTYHFELIVPKESDACSTANANNDEEARAPANVEVSPQKVTITISAIVQQTCDPGVLIRKIRSPRCLYLWKCGSAEVEDPGN